MESTLTCQNIAGIDDYLIVWKEQVSNNFLSYRTSRLDSCYLILAAVNVDVGYISLHLKKARIIQGIFISQSRKPINSKILLGIYSGT